MPRGRTSASVDSLASMIPMPINPAKPHEMIDTMATAERAASCLRKRGQPVRVAELREVVIRRMVKGASWWRLPRLRASAQS